jgi:glycosyltransferase involved in cell wall biosynthesis
MNVGGTSYYVRELIKGISNCELATGFVQGSEIEDPALAQIEIIRIQHLGRRISLINDYKAWKELNNVILEKKPIVVHTHTFKAGLIGRLVRGKHKRIHTFHGHLFNDNSFSSLSKMMIIYIEKILARRTDVLISVGEKVGVEIREVGIGLNKLWTSIPPGVDKLPLHSKSESRKTLNLPANGLLVGWMARMVTVKNPEALLRLAVNLPAVNFVMAGGGDLLEIIKESAPPNVKIIGWVDAALFWSAIDIAISTSDNEGMPIALIEAQHAGVPVVATNVGSNNEVVKDGVTGFITENNVNALTSAVNHFIENPTDIKNFGDQGKIFANTKFNKMTMISLHDNLYKN